MSDSLFVRRGTYGSKGEGYVRDGDDITCYFAVRNERWRVGNEGREGEG